jgi:tetratricopeptide (TPR) repeat protein
MNINENDNYDYNEYDIGNNYIHITANNYFNEGDYSNAILLYDELLKILINDKIISNIYSNKSACYLMLKKYVNALENALFAIKYNITNSKAWGRIGWAYKGLKKKKKSFKAFNIANKLNPNNISYKNEIYYYTLKNINNKNIINIFKSSTNIINKLSNKDIKNKILMNIFTPNKLLNDTIILNLIDNIINEINN